MCAIRVEARLPKGELIDRRIETHELDKIAFIGLAPGRRLKLTHNRVRSPDDYWVVGTETKRLGFWLPDGVRIPIHSGSQNDFTKCFEHNGSTVEVLVRYVQTKENKLISGLRF